MFRLYSCCYLSDQVIFRRMISHLVRASYWLIPTSLFEFLHLQRALLSGKDAAFLSFSLCCIVGFQGTYVQYASSSLFLFVFCVLIFSQRLPILLSLPSCTSFNTCWYHFSVFGCYVDYEHFWSWYHKSFFDAT